MSLKRTSIFLEQRMHKTLRREALDNGITMAEFIRRAVEKELNSNLRSLEKTRMVNQ